jgi:hypothetical protein
VIQNAQKKIIAGQIEHYVQFLTTVIFFVLLKIIVIRRDKDGHPRKKLSSLISKENGTNPILT